MARLPNPGSDRGVWGEILNTYLETAHNEDGTLKNNVVGASNLKDSAVTASAIAPGAITSTKLADNTVAAAKLADGSITEAKLDSALQTKVNAGGGGGGDPTMGGDLSGTASAASIVSGAVDTAELADAAVTTTKLAGSSVTTAKLADDAVSTAKLVDGGVTTAKLASSAVDTATLANDAVTTAKVADAAIAEAKLDAALQTKVNASPTVADGSITTAKLADDAVTTVKITDGDVTTTKLANSSVTAAKVADGSLTPAKLSSDSAVDGEVLSYNAGNFEWVTQSGGGGSGETNTASNVGTGGIGIYKQKTGVDFEFKNVVAASNMVTVTNNAGNNTVDIDVNTANFGLSASDVGLGNVDNTSDAGKPVSTAMQTALDGKAATARTITGTNSVSGGGDLTANRTLSLVNDAASPGNDKYYGTNGAGAKGYFDLPSGGTGSTNASDLDSGTVAVARLGDSGARTNSTVLHGDNVWRVPPGGSGDLTSLGWKRPEDYGSINGTNDQTTIASMKADLVDGDTIYLTPGVTYSTGDDGFIIDNINNLTVIGYGAKWIRVNNNVQAAKSAFMVQNCTGLRLYGLDTAFVNNTGREPGFAGIRAEHVTDFVIRDCASRNARGAGMFFADAHQGSIVDNLVDGSWADGIHMTNFGTNGCTAITVAHNVCLDTGDDAIAVVSYNSGNTICQNITAHDNRIYRSQARGMSIVGGASINYHDNIIVETSSAGIYAFQESSWDTYSNDDCQINHNYVELANTLGGGNQAGIFLGGNVAGRRCRNILVKGNFVKDAGYQGIQCRTDTGSGTREHLRFIDNVVDGCGLNAPTDTFYKGMHIYDVDSVEVRGNRVIAAAGTGITVLNAGGPIAKVMDNHVEGVNLANGSADGIRCGGGTSTRFMITGNSVYDTDSNLDWELQVSEVDGSISPIVTNNLATTSALG